MNYIKDKNILKGFVSQIDLMNTLGGGISMPTVRFKNTDENIIIDIHAPSVSPETFYISVNANRLVIYSQYDQVTGRDSGEEYPTIRIPLFNRTFEIPAGIDIANIEAVYIEEKSTLRISLPLQNTEHSFIRTIPIRYS
jgi:HSP20 family protein